MAIAYENRDHFAIQLRSLKVKIVNKIFALVSRIRRPVQLGQQSKTIILYPAFDTFNALLYYQRKLEWYLPPDLVEDYRFVYACKEEIDQSKLTSRFVHTANFVAALPRAELVLWHRVGIQSLLTLIGTHALLQSKIIDPWYYSTIESQNTRFLARDLISSKLEQQFRRLSSVNFEKLLETQHSKKITLFLSGPNLDRYKEFDYSDSFNVICNSIVRNKELLDHVSPRVVTFFDPVFHFSWNPYTSKFLEDVKDFLSRKNTFCIIPFGTLPLLWGNFPEHRDQLIGIDMNLNRFRKMTPSSLKTPKGSSILTIVMMPLAMSIGEEIQLIGADGRKPDENYFWKHSSSNQYKDLMRSVFIAHPSFFRDRIYTDFYDQYCEELRQRIRLAEAQGITVRTLTPSYVPALKERYDNQ